MEYLSFHVEFLKERYFKTVGQEWEFQVPVTKDMVSVLFQQKGIEKFEFDFDRVSPQSYSLSIDTKNYTPDQWQTLKQDIINVLG